MIGKNKIFAGLIYLSTLSCSHSRETVTIKGEKLPLYQKPVIQVTPTKIAIVEPDPVQVKYAGYLKVDTGVVSNLSLYYFIERWLHTPYKWGGMDERGIDCSAFMQKLLAEVYKFELPRTSLQQFFNESIDRFTSKAHLSEGDLVFFRTMNDKYISHVGLYLHNNMFINSSSSKGVSIASLNDPYWKKRFIAAGRIKAGSRER